MNQEKYSNTFKFDKLADYFKFMITAQIAVLGFLLTAIEKVNVSANLKWLFPTAVIFTALTLAVTLYAKVVLLGALFKEEVSTDKAIKQLYLISGLMLVSVVISTCIKLI